MMSGPVSRLYAAFQQLDGTAMGECYSSEARFTDPLFELVGSEIGLMWKMLCEGATRGTWSLNVSEIEENDTGGSARWEATYAFGPSGRIVHNRISASFVLADDLIHEHEDRFSLWRWSAQALGPIGIAAGWTPPVRSQVRKRARHQLERYRHRF